MAEYNISLEKGGISRLAQDVRENLTEEQAEWLKEVAVAFSNELLNGSNIFTPSLLHQNLINLNNNPETPTYDKLVKALQNAKNTSSTLQG